MLYSFQLSLNNEGNINQKTKVWNFKQVYILRNLKYTTLKKVIKLLYLLDASPRKVEKKYYKEQRITINYVYSWLFFYITISKIITNFISNVFK